MKTESSRPLETPDRAETVFKTAVALPAADRAAHLDRACAGDHPLRQRVEDLLRAHEAAGGSREPSAAPPPPGTIMVALPPEEKPGDQIGLYKILQKLGEGGCGIVCMAEQEHPVRRRVALKVIKLGMDTKQVIARFEAERQALALMDHPNIAKVLDAGATETGRPFFVMELVRGIKITDYCDQHKLTTRERLGLFIQVCNAIQHAHQKGIIHRDIKPSNLLVTLHDGVPVPKVIDFGIAKATQGRLTDQTLFTAIEQFIGTPAYMSPEQAEMSGLDVDTRSDIYALGVLLYELLTGRTPLDAAELTQAGLDELRRTLREMEPARPSTRLHTLPAADLTAVAQRRHTEAPRLIGLLRGDLDWIVMKALEKDRTRRYETANGLAADIQRHLNNEPVIARPPSSLYRFQKLVRRNRTVFAAVGTGMAALIVGLAVVVLLLFQERVARRRAVAAEQEQARLRQQAEANAEYSRKIARAGLLLAEAAGRPQKLREAEQLVEAIPPQPTLVPFYHGLGAFHAQRGRWPEAKPYLQRVVNLAPSDFLGYHMLAPLLLQTGDVDGYRQCCRQMLDRFGDTTDPETAERIAKDCSVLPPSASDLARIGQLADRAVANTNHPYVIFFAFAKGLAEYRQGHYAASADWLKALSTSMAGDSPLRAQVHLAVAMAQHQLEQVEESRASLTAGIETVSRGAPKLEEGNRFTQEWNDWIIAHFLMREALALIRDAKPPGAGVN